VSQAKLRLAWVGSTRFHEVLLRHAVRHLDAFAAVGRPARFAANAIGHR
jgi:hypothetical protein